MIKKLAITGLACVCSLCISAEAFAYSTRSKIYFGADYVYSDIKYKNNTLYEMDDGYNGISPVIGFSSYGVGLEAWYMFSDKAENKHGYESATGPTSIPSITIRRMTRSSFRPATSPPPSRLAAIRK